MIKIILILSLCSFTIACDSDSNDNSDEVIHGTQPIAIIGQVQTGGTANFEGLPDAKIELVLVKAGAVPQLLAEATSGVDGTFSANIAPFSDGVLIATARLGSGVELLSVVGEQVPANIVINELTTVAGAYAGAQFYRNGAIQGEPLPMKIVAGWSANLANPTTGQSSKLLLGSPNADQTNCLRSTRNLANLLAACVEGPDNCTKLFVLTTPTNGIAPTNTVQALVNLARNPSKNVSDIFIQSRLVELYQPSLARQPDAWTLAVKINQTGSAAMPWGGPANTVFDDRGYAWINNNVVQGTGDSTRNIVVLKPDGSPSDGKNGTPDSPVAAGGILGPGFGITRNPTDGHIWVGNYGWGTVLPDTTTNGSVSEILPDGTPASSSQGYFGGTLRVQDILVDPDGNVWMASTGNNQLVVFLGGNPDHSVTADLDCHPFGLALAADGTVWATTAGATLVDLNDCPLVGYMDSMSHWRLNGSALEMISQTFDEGGKKGVDIDLEGYVWTTNADGDDNTVQRFSLDGELVGTFGGGGIESAWDVSVDGAGDIWVANFGTQSIAPGENVFRNSRISVLAGPNSSSGLPIGTPISPETGYTLPSAGEPVLLSDGTPLSETGPGQPSFTPMMRQVSAVPDRAGNIWVTNNWKPNFTTNTLSPSPNPGGDGLVVFVGLGGPTESGRVPLGVPDAVTEKATGR
jgi:hypothetical protein